MELTLIWTIAKRELRDALHNRWLLINTSAFTLLAIALSRASLDTAGYSGLGGFGRTAASLVNVLLLFVPLLGLSLGAASLAGERERGSLAYLLAQPVSRTEVFFGKALGAAMAVMAALLGGFGITAIALSAGTGGNIVPFLYLIGFTILLALVCLGFGVLISVMNRKGSTAMGAALILWLGLAFVSDLGLVGITLTLRPSPAVLLSMLLVNPLQEFKVGAIYGLRASLDALGAVGQYAIYRFGSALPALLAGWLVSWGLLSFGLALWIFNRKGDL